MSDPTPPAECTASISGSCLAESQSETACDTEAGECVYGGQPAPGRPRTMDGAAELEEKLEIAPPVDFLTVHLADGGTWTRLDRLTDGRIMCCLCFNYCTRDQLNPCEGGVEDVCKPCAQREAAVMAARAAALRNDKEGES